MDEKKRLLKNTGLIAVGNFGAKMISFILLPLYTSIITTSQYGTYDFILAVSVFLVPVFTLSMREAMFRFIIDTDKVGKDFEEIVTIGLLVTIIGNILLGMCLAILSLKYSSEILWYIWVYVFTSALYGFANNLLRGMGRIKEYAIISSSKNIVQLILSVVTVAILRWGIQGLLLANCVSGLLAFLIVFFIIKFWEKIHISYVSASMMKQMLTYSIPLIPNTLSAQIINLSDRIIISGFMGTSFNGIYSISYKFPNMAETVYHYFYTAWGESASRVFGKGKEEAKKYYQSMYDYISNMMFSIILLMTAGMPIMFRVFIRGEYIQGFTYVPLLLFAMYFDSLTKFFSGLFVALKKTKVMATTTFIAAIVNILINLIFIRVFGLWAAAGSTLVANIVLFLIQKRQISMKVELTTNYKSAIVKTILAITIVALYSYENWIKIAISILIASIYALIANRAILASICKTISKRGSNGVISKKLEAK